MNDLLVIIPPIAVPMCLADAEIAAVLSYAEQEKSEGTRRAYRSDFRIFTIWCLARGLESMPATASTVARFLSSQADGGLKASTIGRRGAAIGYAHRLAGHEAPGNSEACKAVVRGIRRTIGVAPVRKQPATSNVVGEMLKHCPDTLRGRRDAALLALGFAGAFRRSELVALTVADLVEAPDGYRVMIRRSKTDQDGAGQEIAIPRGCRIEPVRLVQAWLQAAGITRKSAIWRVPEFQVSCGCPLIDATLPPGACEFVSRMMRQHGSTIGKPPATYKANFRTILAQNPLVPPPLLIESHEQGTATSRL
jgi:integrase